MRRIIIGSTFLLRSKRQIDVFTILPIWLSLLDLEDKDQRKRLFTFIVKDLTNFHRRFKDQQTIKSIKKLLYDKIMHGSTNVRILTCCIAVELYKRNIWKDPVTANILANCALSKDAKLVMAATHFLLGTKNHYDVTFAAETKEENVDTSTKIVQAACLQIYSPHDFAEKLLQRCMDASFSHKLTMLNLISRLISTHSLLLPNFYMYLLKYMNPKQKLVTKVLAIAAQAVHVEVPIDVLEPLVRHLMQNFVAEDRGDDVITVGINVIREIAVRSPKVLDKDTIAQVAEFRRYKSKNVTMATKALINLYRTAAPELLHPNLRGREAGTKLSKEKKRKREEGGAETDDDTYEEDPEVEDEDDEKNEDYESGEETEEDDASDDEEEFELDGYELDVDGKDTSDGQEDENEGKENESSSDEESDAPLGVIDPNSLKFGTKAKYSASEKRSQSIKNRMEKKLARKVARSSAGKKQSTTNKVKARNKPALMALQSRRVKNKQAQSLQDKMMTLKKHIKGLKKGNAKKKKRRF
ncbi:hypothetical protein BEWA_047160 [Theileria equi strain WA]|uniref:Protein SDA1 n=1 Tax=Theileria equi strain WA TaxID=1537102 RepID=L1LA08_THEEQ|nr:hypothetical protein BEWA_047160 [Theileria equi strain WA]EKX72252.1 hypothetical protein BEWA_047160 [Theileria equi strain WA]|eukprot:XP_004831704.1 hypothetical protein BEWA_047160 [Theileria equi strain WA]